MYHSRSPPYWVTGDWEANHIIMGWHWTELPSCTAFYYIYPFHYMVYSIFSIWTIYYIAHCLPSYIVVGHYHWVTLHSRSPPFQSDRGLGNKSHHHGLTLNSAAFLPIISIHSTLLSKVSLEYILYYILHYLQLFQFECIIVGHHHIEWQATGKQITSSWVDIELSCLLALLLLYIQCTYI